MKLKISAALLLSTFLLAAPARASIVDYEWQPAEGQTGSGSLVYDTDKNEVSHILFSFNGQTYRRDAASKYVRPGTYGLQLVGVYGNGIWFEPSYDTPRLFDNYVNDNDDVNVLTTGNWIPAGAPNPAVPEPSTFISAALLLVPFAAGFARKFRNH